MSGVFSVRLFVDENEVKEFSADINEQKIVFAEDLMIIIAKEVGINPKARHLFSLFHSSNKIWTASNQKLSEWKETRKFEFRLRFRPPTFAKLKKIDVKAFYYYFYQIRNDFLNGKFVIKSDDIVYGLAVTDMVVEILKKNISIESAFDSLDPSNFLPMNGKKHNILLLKHKIQKALLTAWNNSNKDVDFVVQEYMKLMSSSVPNYGTENYQVMFNNHRKVNEVQVEYRPHDDDGLSIRSISGTKNSWFKLCQISDLCFISIHSENRTVEIARRNGIPFQFTFKHDLHMKSFVSLLDGYYRLSEKWSFNICKEISSPSLIRLKALKCHGPVGREFAYNKLREKGNKNCGTFILRESASRYCGLKLDVIVRNDFFKTYSIIVNNNNYTVEESNEQFESFADLVSHFMVDDDLSESVIILRNCIPPSEYDDAINLRLCKADDNNPKSFAPQSNLDVTWPHIIPSDCLKLSKTTLTKNSRYGVRLASVNNQTVIVKEVKSENLTHDFLKIASQWAHLRSDSIVLCKGITLYSPLSIVLEYLQIGPLDAFLMVNQPKLEVVDLIESVTYLARALWYLHENGIIHGHIRCHNLLVSHHSADSLRVKLSDPISDNDVTFERPWLPPEFSDKQDPFLASNQMTSAVDVWSFGTTVWQIFSYGQRPNCDNARELSRPSVCPEEVWSLINECWANDCDVRKQPHSIVRDISQIMYEIFNSRRTQNHYSSPVYDKKSNNKSNIIKSIFGSQSSLSSSSIFSAQSTITFLTGNDSSIRSELDCAEPGYDVNNTIYTNNEPWVIESNQIRLGKVLGQGCYGEVLKATLTQFAGLKEETVAVKRIKSVPSDTLLRDMKREIEIMKKLSHKNIVEIKGFVEEPQTMLVMEYVELGSLVAYLKMHKSNKNSLPLMKFASDITNGMQYLESKSIVHRDLAARNILVATPNHVKISDFGLAQLIGPNDQYYHIQTQRELPLRWYAPESLKFGRFSHKSDIWSYGVVLWEMYSFGENPLYPGHVPDAKLIEALESGLRLPCPPDCPLQIYQLMIKCWHTHSQDRPTFTELKHSIEEINQ